MPRRSGDAKPKPKPNYAARSRPRKAPSRPAVEKPSSGEGDRLHKKIAASGRWSRRAAEDLIREGRVSVNQEVVMEMGVKVGPDDVISVDGIKIEAAKTYTLVMNKPVGYVTTLSDPQRRKTVKQLLPDMGVTLKPVGRLDMDSEGLLLFSNDGELAHRLTHPRYGVEKEYEVTILGHPGDDSIRKLEKGIWIEEGGKTAPAKLQVVHDDGKGPTSVYRITIHEGRKRQVRLMFEAVGHEVKNLRRVRYGSLILRGLRAGECRMLGMQEIDALKQLVGLKG